MRIMDIDLMAFSITVVALGVTSGVFGLVFPADSIVKALMMVCGLILVGIGVKDFIRSIDWEDDRGY